MTRFVRLFCLVVLTPLVLYTAMQAADVPDQRTLEGRYFVRIGGEWYQDYRGKLFPVIEDVLSLRFNGGEYGESDDPYRPKRN